jgi:hypothetical protein
MDMIKLYWIKNLLLLQAGLLCDSKKLPVLQLHYPHLLLFKVKVGKPITDSQSLMFFDWPGTSAREI